ncbi:MAG: hypothetical protein V1755_10130 [Chloroflexota bacterium]
MAGRLQRTLASNLIRHKALLHASILVAYGIVTLAMTYPWILHFADHTPDWGSEASVFLWNLWHFRQSLWKGSPFETTLLAPPFKLSLVFHTYSLSRDILALPLLPLFGVVATSNLLTLLSFSVSGLGAYLLVHDLTGDRTASFVAGIVFAFAPYRFAHLAGHYQLITIEWLALYALFAVRYFRQGGRLNLCLGSLFALATSLTDYYYALFLIVWSGMLAVYRLVSDQDRWETLRRTGLLAGLALSLHLPLMGLMYRALLQGAWVGRPAGVQMLEVFSADLASLLIPSVQHPLFGEWARRFSMGWNWDFAEHNVYLGILPLCMMIASSLRYTRWSVDGRFWILTFWLFILLALGPVLHWRGQALFPLPAQWLVETPILREARVPSRWIIMGILSLTVVVGQVLAWIRQRWSRSANAVTILVAAIVLFEYLPAPLSLADRSVPLVYQEIARDPEPGSVLDVPPGLADSFVQFGGWNPEAMYFQTITARPYVGAHISRIPSIVWQTYAEMPIIGRMGRIEMGQSYSRQDVIADRRGRERILELLDLRFLVIRAAHEGDPDALYILDVLDGCIEKMPSDDQASGYRILRPCPPAGSPGGDPLPMTREARHGFE